MIDRPSLILILMGIGILWGFSGVVLSLYGLVHKDFIIMIVGFVSWIGLAVPMFLDESKKVKRWENEYWDYLFEIKNEGSQNKDSGLQK